MLCNVWFCTKSIDLPSPRPRPQSMVERDTLSLHLTDTPSNLSHNLQEIVRVVEMARFAIYQPSAVVNEELDESIEVALDTITRTACASYCSFLSGGSNPFSMASNTETIGVTESYDSGARAINDMLSGLEESGKKSPAEDGKEFNIERTRTDETSVDSWSSVTSSDCQVDGEIGYSTDEEDETDSNGKTEDDIESAVTEIVNATDGESPDVKGIKNNYVTDVYASSDAQKDVLIYETEQGPKIDGIAVVECVVVDDANGESTDEKRNLRACRTGASPDKLSAMVVNPFRAIQSILDVRVCECEHRINTLKYLKTKNGDYTKQASALQAENDALNVLCNAESDGLKDLFRKRLDRDDIVNHDIVKDAVQDLESKNTNYASDLENLVSSLQGTVVLNVELQAQVEQVSAANEELVKLNNDYEEKIAELSHVVECLTKSLNDERSMHETEIEEMKKMMEMVGTMSDQFVQLVCWGIKSNRPQHVLQQ